MENTDLLKFASDAWAELVKIAPVFWIGLVTVFSALWSPFKSIPSLLEFYDERVQKRVFNRYSFLFDKAKDNEKLKGFVRTAQEAEIFRGIFRKPVSPKMASAIMDQYHTGQFSLPELRALFPYMHVDADGSLGIKPGRRGYLVWVFMPIFFILYGWFTYISINRFLSQQSALTFFSALGQLVLYGLGCFFLVPRAVVTQRVGSVGVRRISRAVSFWCRSTRWVWDVD